MSEYDSLYNKQSRPYHYHSDGRGRDTYIGFNNGGMYKNATLPRTSEGRGPIHYKKLNFTKDPKTKKIYGDGSGRDSYVLDDNGGLHRDDKALAAYNLTDFLRTKNEGLTFYNRTQYPQKFNKGYSSFPTKNELLQSKERFRIQEKSINKLFYENNKHLKKDKPEIIIEKYFMEENNQATSNIIDKFPNIQPILNTSKTTLNIRSYNLSCHIFPHQRKEELEDHHFINDVKKELGNFKDFEIKQKKIKQLIHNCHNIDKVLSQANY